MNTKVDRDTVYDRCSAKIDPEVKGHGHPGRGSASVVGFITVVW